MDLRAFYKKLRKVEQEIADEHVVVVSLETPDGGREGLKTEVARLAAARLIVEGRARLGDAKESAQHRDEMRVAQRGAEQRALQERVQVHVISDADARALSKK